MASILFHKNNPKLDNRGRDSFDKKIARQQLLKNLLKKVLRKFLGANKLGFIPEDTVDVTCDTLPVDTPEAVFSVKISY